MKKVVDLLEKNVQWLALGLGVIYVLWMAYTYVIQKPVVVKVGQEELRPGEVDRYIVNNAANELRTRMNNPGTVTFKSPTWQAGFQDELAYKGTDAVAALPPIFPVNRTGPARFEGGGGPRPIDVFVEKLPVLPPALMGEARTGRSTVQLPARVAAAPAPAGGAVVQPVANQAATGVDKLWITVLYRLPTVEIATAFRDVKVPFEQYQTSVLAAELWRQEQLPDGSWGPEKRIAPLPTVQIQPLPAPTATVAVKNQFLTWANNNTVSILQPPFYNVLAGDGWAPPGQEIAPVEAAPVEEFDPAKWVNATQEELMQLSVDQRRQVAAYKQKLKEEEAKNRGQRGPKGSTGGGKGMGVGGGGGKGGPLGPDDDGRPTTWQDEGRGDFQPQPQDPRGGDFQPQPQDDRDAQPAAAGEAPAAIGGDFPIPIGAFDPRNTPDAVCWAHDDTIEAGKTYRYKVVYTAKSPVWNTEGVTKPTELAQTFALVSDKDQTQWSEPISMESSTKFFVKGQTFKGDAAQIQVFRWSGGQLQTKTFEVSPGDAVGRPDSGIDFSTGWTLVDMRNDPRTDERVAILMDQYGHLHHRDIRSDVNNPEFKRMAAEAAVAGTGAGSDAVAGTR